MLHLLDDRSSSVRTDALERLGELGGAMARVAARACLQDPEMLVRIAAIEILGEVGRTADLPRLAQALGDREWLVRRMRRTAWVISATSAGGPPCCGP